MKTFAGIPAEYADYERAKIVMIPVPYDGTSTWIKGADGGPAAVLEALENMELYDIETDTEVYQQGVYLETPVSEQRTPELMVDAVHHKALEHIDNGKFVTLFGGEHSISIGSIRAFADRFENLTVIQIDAHADLRPEFHGSKCNHACAVYEASKKHNLLQVGIRSMDVEEKEHTDYNKVWFAHQIQTNPNWMEQVVAKTTENVFITIDLDAFDSSIMPSTGTPEPGGLYWYEMVDFLKLIFERCNVVGFDIVELCPSKHNKAPDFLAAKLYYKMLSYKFYYQNK